MTEYQSLERIKARIDYDADAIFGDDPNADKRFDRLIMGEEAVGDGAGWLGLEAEARQIIETHLGDETLAEELGRTDTIRPTYDAALTLVYPIQDVTKVEYKRSLRSDWDTLDAGRYTHTEHRLILGGRRRHTPHGSGTRRNVAADFARRATWADIAEELRVTYDRGFSEIPYNVQSIQISLINRMVRLLKAEQTFAAASPDEWAGVSPEFDSVVTEEIRDRIGDVTGLGGVTQSV